MDLLSLKNKYKETGKCYSILLYGRAFTGKTQLAATVSNIPSIKRIIWLDLNNGLDTVLNMNLSEEALKKIIPIKMADSRMNPYIMPILLKIFSSPNDISLCPLHGKISCPSCKERTTININKMTSEEILVIDSLSDVATAAINFVLKGKEIETSRISQPEWGEINGFMVPIFQRIQGLENTRTLCIAHTIEKEVPHPLIKNEKETHILPFCGSEPFSRRLGTFFSTIVYMDQGFKAISSYKKNIMAGSRLNIAVEKDKSGFLSLFGG